MNLALPEDHAHRIVGTDRKRQREEINKAMEGNPSIIGMRLVRMLMAPIFLGAATLKEVRAIADAIMKAFDDDPEVLPHLAPLYRGDRLTWHEKNAIQSTLVMEADQRALLVGLRDIYRVLAKHQYVSMLAELIAYRSAHPGLFHDLELQ